LVELLRFEFGGEFVMTRITRLLAPFALLAAVAGSTGVQAANSAFNWSGWYVTAGAGYGWRAKNSYPPDSYYTGLGADFSGGLGYGGSSGGGTPSFKGPAAAFGAGYNYQFKKFIIGAEYEFLYADLQTNPTSATTAFTKGGGFFPPAYIVSNYDTINGDSNRWYGIGRLRAGMPLFDRGWVYLSAGAAYRLHYASQDPTVTVIPYLSPSTTTTYSGYNKAHAWGLVLGAGFEYAMLDNWFVRAEWLHMDFGKDTYLDPVATALIGTPTMLTFNRHADIGRAGLTYRFYGGGYR
jgi:outer membrane immunogenic protein